MRFHIIRHALSDANESGVLEAHTDSYLSRDGRAQAKQIPKFLNVPDDTPTYCSPFERTRQTARLAGLKPREVDDLREMGCGSWDGIASAEFSRKFNGLPANERYRTEVGGGESLEQVFKRAKSVLLEISQESQTDEAIVVGHGAWIRTLFAGLLADGLPGFVALVAPENASLSVVELSHDGTSRILSYNGLLYPRWGDAPNDDLVLIAKEGAEEPDEVGPGLTVPAPPTAIRDVTLSIWDEESSERLAAPHDGTQTRLRWKNDKVRVVQYGVSDTGSREI